jgi:hypothetical protein
LFFFFFFFFFFFSKSMVFPCFDHATWEYAPDYQGEGQAYSLKSDGKSYYQWKDIIFLW